MKITFPHMGNMYISIKVLLDTVGMDYVIPPNCNKKTLEYGVLNSPESVCLPFKIILGDFIHGIKNGAEFILFGGGCGQCRLGYFGDLQKEILKSLGFKTEFVYLELNNMSFKDVMNKLRPLTKGKSTLNMIKGIVYAAKTAFIVDKLYRLANYTRCREINHGETDNIMRQFHNAVRKAKGYKGISKVLLSTRKSLGNINIDRKFKPLKIAIVGEIYAAIEPYTNLEIERKLGNMGVEVHNILSVSRWVLDHFIKKILPVKLKNKAVEAGKEFMKTDDIGGHGIYTIGNSILCAGRSFDGIIHIYPFTCMPEIIAQSTFGAIQKKYKIPIMTLIIDEMTGEAGYMTRIEAFVDMLERKRRSGKVSMRFCQ